jgi:hypothetical protein
MDGQATNHQATYPLVGDLPHSRDTAQFIGIVFDQPDQESAIKKAIEEYGIPENQRNRLIAQRRGLAVEPETRYERNQCHRALPLLRNVGLR